MRSKQAFSKILNDIGRNSLLGNRKKIAKFFNEDFYLPLYLPLWLIRRGNISCKAQFIVEGPYPDFTYLKSGFCSVPILYIEGALVSATQGNLTHH
jgi:hypothetical protein